LGIKLHVYSTTATYKSVIEGVQNNICFSIPSILFFAILRHIYDYRQLKQSALQLKIEKQEAELNYLKAQTNPHFLFNTLNNIYALAKDKSDLAPESIMRLSKILRYMLYETKGDFTTLSQELKILNDYIALEKLRYDDSLRIDFQQVIDNWQQPIPPLLLIPLVENAFKHGASETREQPFVELNLTVKSEQLLFSVKNSAEKAVDTEGGIFSFESRVSSFELTDDPLKTQNSKLKTDSEGIGLSNLRRQLALLYSDYNLTINKAETTFETILKINLKSHV
jgi:two-component system, LytTR family, sensor kinase